MRAQHPTLGQLATCRGERLAYPLLTGDMIALASGLAAGDVTLIRAARVAGAGGPLVFVATLARVLGHLLPYDIRTPRAAVDEHDALNSAPEIS